MFTKLRNKFLILNMSITSMVMIAAFAIIYFISYSNIHSDIRNKLSSGPVTQVAIEGNDLSDDAKKGGTMAAVQHVEIGGPPLFHIEVDANGKMVNVDSFIDMPQETYTKAAEIAWSNKKNNSSITIEGKQWQYAIERVSKSVVLGNGKQLNTVESNYLITFLDVTEANKTLLQLLTTLIFVGVGMLAVIFIISLIFANRAIRPIAETWEKQKQFVADASHELKTPLSIINANFDVLMANQEETVQSQLKWLGYIRIGTDRMAKLINDLLALARLETIHVEAPKTPFNMSDVIRDVMLSMEAAAMEKGIKLTYSIEPDLLIKSDPEKVQQVTAILLDNAIKYANERGQIHISLLKSKRHAVCSIKNSGKGIPKQDLPKVFDRFYRADPSRTHENGSYGLGLAIAKTIMDGLGGEIQATSAENEWTTFTFTLGL
ncbi:histidine kinase [Gordoniibacillus kamchatkensis]|uniref:histidine kinase n=1 Tax=Gordoniibacillus kamchatkensis TaxID=1590651 RepID=A0ABR5ADG8_9BACL|nr:HAMP domain-containing sensor histidine kinase [Paenibacillus sp. VKM B-2647]KIL38635.1 histidine kinase [Paenibacillus sp. VKM B-2647]